MREHPKELGKLCSTVQMKEDLLPTSRGRVVLWKRGTASKIPQPLGTRLLIYQWGEVLMIFSIWGFEFH